MSVDVSIAGGIMMVIRVDVSITKRIMMFRSVDVSIAYGIMMFIWGETWQECASPFKLICIVTHNQECNMVTRMKNAHMTSYM